MLDDLIYLIAQANLGTPTVDLFKGSVASVEGPGPIVSVTTTAGSTSPLSTHNLITVPSYVRSSALVLVRAERYEDAETRAKAIYELLYPIRRRMVNGTWWVQVPFIQEPYDLGPDAQQRPQLGFNLTAEKRYSAATSGSV